MSDTYSGKEVFNSEAEYTKFKQALVEDNVRWATGNIQVLSSDPPIIVKYSVEVDKGQIFPYGNYSDERLTMLILMPIVLIFILFMLYLAAGGEHDMAWLFRKK
jgi:hypothetical protein